MIQPTYQLLSWARLINPIITEMWKWWKRRIIFPIINNTTRKLLHACVATHKISRTRVAVARHCIQKSEPTRLQHRSNAPRQLPFGFSTQRRDPFVISSIRWKKKKGNGNAIARIYDEMHFSQCTKRNHSPLSACNADMIAWFDSSQMFSDRLYRSTNNMRRN